MCMHKYGTILARRRNIIYRLSSLLSLCTVCAESSCMLFGKTRSLFSLGADGAQAESAIAIMHNVACERRIVCALVLGQSSTSNENCTLHVAQRGVMSSELK